jgi:hypothetical protein
LPGSGSDKKPNTQNQAKVFFPAIRSRGVIEVTHDKVVGGIGYLHCRSMIFPFDIV